MSLDQKSQTYMTLIAHGVQHAYRLGKLLVRLMKHFRRGRAHKADFAPLPTYTLCHAALGGCW